MKLYNMEASLLFLLFVFFHNLSATPSWYLQKRREFVVKEFEKRLGANLPLTFREELVNKFLMRLKIDEIYKARTTQSPYLASLHFFESRSDIEKTEIFQLIKMMPKGGALHTHSSAITSLEWFIKTSTSFTNLFTRWDTKTKRRMYMFSNETNTAKGSWENIHDMKQRLGNKTFDEKIIKELSLWTTTPEKDYRSVNQVWDKFNTYFKSHSLIHATKETLRSYYKQGMEEFYKDGVQYMEIRFGFVNRSLLDGSYMSAEEHVDLVLETEKQMKAKYPDFIGVKAIQSGFKSETKQQMKASVKEAIQLMHKYPNTIKGFDLVQQEDNHHMLQFFVDELLIPHNRNITLPYFFHAGETDWNQGPDMNMVDAVLLNTTRIGHGFAILHHPKVLELAMQGKITIELNPVSNQVLGLVKDLRNHPGSILISNGCPVVVSSDDPVVWGALPLSHDFYMAFMALGGVQDDIRLLKQLAINSFLYSTMEKQEIQTAVSTWNKTWHEFIDRAITRFKLL